jgi:hypothetical protein
MYAGGGALVGMVALECLQEANVKADWLMTEEKTSTVQGRQFVGTLLRALGVMVRPMRDLHALEKVIVAEGESWYVLVVELSTTNYLHWGVLTVDQKEKVLVVADFDWSYVLLRVSISVYSFYKA